MSKAAVSEDAEFIRHYAYPNRIKTWAYGKWLSLGFTKGLKLRRVEFIDGLLGGVLSQDSKILEVGCGSGRDFIKSMAGHPCQLYGLDPFDTGLRQPNFQFISGEMSHIPFPDRFFDATLTFGVMEHIQPLEALSVGIKEMVRVSKKYCMVVPCITTRFEPHVWKYHWQFREPPRWPTDLNYMSDAAWTKFEGFKNVRTARFDYIPLLIKNLMIYGVNE